MRAPACMLRLLALPLVLALLVPALVSTVLATLATTGLLELWHVTLGNFISGTMWSTEMSTRRRMVGEVAGPHRIVPAIALDSATNAATRMIGPILGGVIFGWLGMRGAYTLTALVQFMAAFALAGLAYEQVIRRLDLARIPAEIAEGLAFARTRNTILLVYGVTVVTHAFAFAYAEVVERCCERHGYYEEQERSVELTHCVEAHAPWRQPQRHHHCSDDRDLLTKVH